MLHAPLTLTTAKLDISLLLKSSPSPPPPPNTSPRASSRSHLVRSTSVPATAGYYPPLLPSSRNSSASNASATTLPTASSTLNQPYLPAPRPVLPPLGNLPPYPIVQPSPRNPPQNLPPSHLPAKRPPPTATHPSASPAKKQSKWTPEEDALIIDLRGSGMKWEDISKRLPGRSAISCRLHYQNYLERRSEWDEERKNRLARLYERLKSEMWAPLAAELGIPWRAAEAMHWQLGEADMARRAGVVPFSLAPSPGSGALPPGTLLPGTGTFAAGGSALGAGYGSDRRSPPRRRESGSREGAGNGPSGGLLPSVAELERGILAYDSPGPGPKGGGGSQGRYSPDERRRRGAR